MNLSELRKIKKVELHAHLDGSLRIPTMIDIAKREGISLPSSDEYELYKNIKFYNGMDLKKCLKSFNVTLSVMQSEYALEQISYELCEDLSKDNVIDAEIRYCPLLHTNKGLGLNNVIEATLKGLEAGKNDFGIDTRLIFCAIRDLPPQDNVKLVKTAEKYMHKGVVGIDLAGNEYDYPPELHKKTFQLAKKIGLHRTAHGGEMRRMFNRKKQKDLIEQGVKNIWTLINDCEIERLGHGISMMYDKNLMKEIKRRGIAVEISLTSNLQTGAITRYKQHPLPLFYESGIKTVICSDDLTLCNTFLSKEMQKAMRHYDFVLPDMRKMTKYAKDARFLL